MKKDNKTLGITLRFWTNHLPECVGRAHNQIPCWSAGVVIMEANKTKGIPADSEIFNYIEDIPRAVKEVIKRAKIVLVEDVGYTESAKKRVTVK